MAETRQIYWRLVDGTSLEQFYARFDQEGLYAESRILANIDGEHSLFRYWLQTDQAFRTRLFKLEALRETEVIPIRRELTSDGQGHWQIDQREAPALEGALDVDFRATPATNILPIRRLSWREGEAQSFPVVYIHAPSLKIESREQRYTCLKTLSENGGAFRFEAPDIDFSVDLPVDAQGLVIDYPGIFERTGAA